MIRRLFTLPTQGRWRREVRLQVRNGLAAIRLDKEATNDFRSIDLACLVCRYTPAAPPFRRSLRLSLRFNEWRVFDLMLGET